MKLIPALLALSYIAVLFAWMFDVGGLNALIPFWAFPLSGVLLAVGYMRKTKAISERGTLERLLDFFALYGAIAGLILFGVASGLVFNEPIVVNGFAKAGLALFTISILIGLIPKSWIGDR